ENAHGAASSGESGAGGAPPSGAGSHGKRAGHRGASGDVLPCRIGDWASARDRWWHARCDALSAQLTLITPMPYALWWQRRVRLIVNSERQALAGSSALADTGTMRTARVLGS